ncbi:MAG: DUF3370 family protein [Candidatus Sericytochromatia bacterium]
MNRSPHRRQQGRVLPLCICSLLLSSLLASCASIQEQPQEAPAVEAPTAPPWASAQALETLASYGVEIDSVTRDKLQAIARKAARPGNSLEQADLDLNSDGQVSRKEVQFLLSWRPEQLSGEGRYRLQSQPQLLPNRSVSGMVQLHVNNPEQVSDPGVLFDSRRLRGGTPLHLGQRDHQRFEVFSYTNYLSLRQKHGPRGGPGGQPLKSAWYAVLIHNPVQNGPVTLTVMGTGMLNEDNPAAAARMLTQLPPAVDASAREAASERIKHPTRSNDADLQYRMLHPERHALHKAATVSAGRSMMLYVRLPMVSGLQDFRGQFQFQVQDADLKEPLRLQAAVLTALPVETQSESGLLADLDPQAFAPRLQAQLREFVEPRPRGASANLRQASDLSSPQALASEIRRRQIPNLSRIARDYEQLSARLAGRPAELPPWLSSKDAQVEAVTTRLRRSGRSVEDLLAPYLSADELEQYIARAKALASELDSSPALDERLMSRIRGWNAEIKMIQRVLGSPPTSPDQSADPSLQALLGAMVNPLWDTLFTLGRVNGVVQGNLIASTLPDSDLEIQPGERSREWNYVFNTNPYTTGGAQASEAQSPPLSLVDAVSIISQSANVASPPVRSYGNYGMRYRIDGRLRNASGQPQTYDIRIGSPDELGHVDWRSLFDQTDTLLAESSTRYTGTLRLITSVDGEPPHTQEYSLIHGRVQAPQSLLPQAGQLQPGSELKLRVELVIPTNSTAPQLLQLKASEAPVQNG